MKENDTDFIVQNEHTHTKKKSTYGFESAAYFAICARSMMTSQ